MFTEVDNGSDCISLQRDVTTIAEWCKQNYMQLHVDKCFVMSFTNKRHKVHFDYMIEGTSLQRKSVARDLGVYFDGRLTFRDHYDFLVSKTCKTLGFVARATKEFQIPRTLIGLFNALIRSTLEYACVVWSPFYEVHSKRLESVQNKVLKIASYRLGVDRKLSRYGDRLSHFKVMSLNSRRRVQDLLHLHKLLHGSLKSSMLLSHININFNVKHNPRRPPRPFVLNVYTNNTSFYNPLTRMCRAYNDLIADPGNVVDMDIFDGNFRRFRKQIHKCHGFALS